ncbi:ribosome maturation factor RimP [Myxococcota bacterium]|nr:ribosome maturation factor RimP [Myxococcota bacterium]
MRTLIDPVVGDAGLELVDVLINRGKQPWQVRVIVDTPQSDGRVPIDQCAEVARELSTNFDAADPIPVSYQLEVSSPGLDRILARQKDFEAACGFEIKLQTREPLDGRRRFRGKLLAFDGEIARVEVEGRTVGIPFDEVAKANLVYEFTRSDFAPEVTSG